MPYNNTPIPPTQEVSGTCTLPLARIKKIVAADPDTGICSNNAAFAICVATESFIQYLVEQTHTVVKSELKPRRNIQYKDVARAVTKYDNLDFLADVVPNTVPFAKYKERQGKAAAVPEEEAPTGQQRLAFGRAPAREDEEMNGAGMIHEPAPQHQPISPPSVGSPGRPAYDPVRNTFDGPIGHNVPMEED